MRGIKYRKLEEMKDSGIRWLGEIPKEWEVTKLKYEFKNFESGKRESYDKEEILSIGGEHIFGEKFKLTNPRYVSYKYYRKSTAGKIKKNDILLVKDGATIGKCMFVSSINFDAMVNEHVYRIEYSKYGYYVILAKNTQEQFWMKNNSTAQESINSTTLKNIDIIKNNIEEQQQIAGFLDVKTAQFDSIISKKEKLIEKLEEAKRSIISEVVTGKVKIVNGQMVKRKPEEMKDSGVKWLGMIPEEWEVKKIKYISECYPSNVDKKSKKGEKTVKLCNYTDVYYNNYITSSIDFMEATASSSQIIKYILKKGDIILTKDSESPDDIGIASYVTEDIKNLVCGYHLTLIKVFKSYNSQFIYFQLLSTGVRNYFETVANGVTRYGIGIDGFKNLSICIPTNEEQQLIAAFIEDKIKFNSKIINKTQTQIQKLKEAKQSLISEAVTGKIDLRDWEIVEEGGA